MVRNTVRSFGEINLTMFEKYDKRRSSDPVTVEDRVQELGILVVRFCDDKGEKCFWFCPRFSLSSTEDISKCNKQRKSTNSGMRRRRLKYLRCVSLSSSLALH